MQSNFTKLDMHMHSEYSKDCRLKLKTIARFLDKNMDYGIVLSDHNETAGALELSKSYPDRVIVAEEIKTDCGEITGLFLKQKIEPYNSIHWTLDAIISQGGLVYIPHPCDRLRTSKLTDSGLAAALQKADIVEVYNSRNVYKKDDEKALKLAVEHDITHGCGSDAHTIFEMGRSYAKINAPFELSPDGLMEALRGCELVKRRSFLGVHFLTKWDRFKVKHNDR
jgi:predicted metal-dependent phosphoesterase TrpH